MEEATASRGNFSGRMGFILAAAGSAVGLGNLWRFPYLAEQYGGGMFLLVYVLLAVTFGFILMLTEVTIGRRTGKSCIDAFGDLCKKYRWIGWLAAAVPVIIVPYYCVIGGWVLYYFFSYATGASSAAADPGYFDSFISCTGGILDSPVIWFLIFALVAVVIVAAGVEKGIERISKILMPVLLVLLVVIAVYVLTIPGAMEGVKHYIIPDFSTFSMSTVLGAMGQLFYSMSLAMGIMITYGSYMKKEVNISKSVRSISMIDTIVAFMAGLMIIPVVFMAGGEMTSGPGLMFQTLPMVFDGMPGGAIVGGLFFILVFVAALTSAMSLCETIVSVLKDRLKMRRSIAVGIVLALVIGLGMLSCLGYGPLAGIQILGQAFLDFFDFITNSVMMPIVAILTCVFVGFIIKPKVIIDEVRTSGEFKSVSYYSVMVKWVCPILLFLILVTGLLSFFGIYSI